ncbi:MAG: hypothetical protein JRH11_11910 [Deltaproteobacteria bacterium]|nr:hypothetical protein [Deltaproteobacteria bacterium]
MRVFVISSWCLVFALCFWGCGDDGGGATDSGTDATAMDSATTSDSATADSSSGDSSAGDSGTTDDASPGDSGAADTGSMADAGGANCDDSTVRCRLIRPDCPDGQVPEVDGSCWADRCLPIDACACTSADHCPEPERYTCHMFSSRCGPYL